MDKSYDPKSVEARLYAAWEESGAFACGRAAGADPYTIVIPPPNVTGSLHMGHALNNTLQDILIRYARARGRDALWQPGTDHAGIATQMVVERKLAEAGESKQDLGREAFIGRVWAWKEESGGAIIRQLRRLGASCDWERERFTMDDGLSAAVRRVFVSLFKAGLIYRDKRLVNWDPELRTAISDLEVEQRETEGKLWYFRYPVEGEDGVFLTVATTRPETMLGDTGVAVHPEDARYQKFIGRHCVLPVAGRRLPVVADEYADPEKGSGAVKMTPAHDFNDFEVGRRHNLKMVNVFDAGARLNGNAPEAYRGLDRFEARKKITAEMESLGLLEKVEDNPMTVPYGDRSGAVIEPWLMDQWFVDAQRLAGPAITAVEQGRTKFVPKQWENTYYEWMRGIQPWCVSRQLWWGHRIPAWFGPDGDFFVEMTEAEASAEAEKRYGRPVELKQDPDVLDTWFSSALWPFSTLGWPDGTPELKRHYPTDVLVTGFDIIFFWVARMMMMGLHFMDEVPFHTVYIHALVRDEKGRKMSKSKGNVIDPLDLIERYGADALRFTLTSLAAQGRDVRLSESRVEGHRNFCTKIWNAARFCEMNGCALRGGFDPAEAALPVNRWIAGKFKQAAAETEAALAAYRFNDAAAAQYSFIWGTFCGWYLELIKPVLSGPDGAAKDETRAAAAWVLSGFLHTLHPVMPFITEELWRHLAGDRGGFLADRPWPASESLPADAEAEAELDWLVRLISAVRSVRAELNVPPAAEIALGHMGAGDVTQRRLSDHAGAVRRLARISGIGPVDAVEPGAVQIVVDEAVLTLPLAGVIDISAEKARLDREISRLDGEIARFDKKLADGKFTANAPPEVIETERARRAETAARRRRLEEARARLARAEG